MRYLRMGTIGLVVATAACSSGGADAKSAESTPAAISVVARAADAADAARTARVEAEVVIETTSRTTTTRTEGVTDFRTGNASLTSSLDGLLPGATSDTEERFVDGVLYVDYLHADPRTELSSELSARPWVRIEFPGAPLTTGAQNFGDQLAVLRGVGKVEEAGTETIRGTGTTRYLIEVDVDAALRKVSSDRARFEHALSPFKTSRIGGAPAFAVWLGADGLPRRMTMSRESSGAGDPYSVSLRIDYFDFGTRLSVHSPPADRVMSVEEFKKLGPT